MLLSRRKAQDFNFLNEKVKQNLSAGRTIHFLEQEEYSYRICSAGHPICAIFTSDILFQNCSRIDVVTRKFWWKGAGSDNNFIAWKDWGKLCQPKKNGGLG